MCETIDEIQYARPSTALARARQQREASKSKEERPLEAVAQ